MIKMSESMIQSCISSLSNDTIEYFTQLFVLEEKINDFKAKHPFFVVLDQESFFKEFFN